MDKDIKNLDEMTVKELREVAETSKITIPREMVKRDDILKFLKEEVQKNAEDLPDEDDEEKEEGESEEGEESESEDEEPEDEEETPEDEEEGAPKVEVSGKAAIMTQTVKHNGVTYADKQLITDEKLAKLFIAQGWAEGRK